MIKVWKANPITDVNDIHIFEVIPEPELSFKNKGITIAAWTHNEFVRGNRVHLIPCFDSLFLCTNEETNRLEEKYFSVWSRIIVRLGDDIQLYIVEQL